MANPSGRQAEIGFATILIAVAVWAFVEAGEYPGSSGTYPRVLAVLLASGAALVVARTLRQAEEEGAARLFLHAGRFALGAAALVAYIVAIGLLGYLLPSLVAGIALPALLGYRNTALSAAVTVGTILFIVAVFFVLLGRPLPPDMLDPLLEALR